jgi:outer membrane biogenesis lipoprotein LolB
MKLVKISLSIAALALLSACATPVKPTYVSPTLYQTLGCSQLQGEYNRIQQYIDNGVEPPKRTGVGVGVSVNMGQSSDTKRTELARLLGEQEAIVQAARYKNCPIIVRQATPK